MEIFYCLRWIDTLGGPHLLLAQELLSSWGGDDGCGDPADLSTRMITLGPVGCRSA
jgi:hypothetical protein